MPAQGKDYSPFPSGSSNSYNQQPSSSYATSTDASYYPYYTTDSAQYYSQYYSNYYSMPAQQTSYAQAYIDAAYSEAFPQVTPVAQEGYLYQGSQQPRRSRSNNQQRKKNSDKLPVAYCNECSKPFYSNLDYQNHLKCHVNCPDCGLTLTKKQLVTHRNEAHPKLITVDDSSDIQSYIAERKGKYPVGKGKEKVQDIPENTQLKADQEGSKKRKMVSVGYCKFYPLGKCKKGTGCPFYHELQPGQEEKRFAAEDSNNSMGKSQEKKKVTSKIVPKDRTKLLELLNEEYMEREDSILLQVIRYMMDKKGNR